MIGSRTLGVEQDGTADDAQVDGVDEMISLAEEYVDHSEVALEAAESTAAIVDEQLRTAERIRDRVARFDVDDPEAEDRSTATDAGPS